MTNKRDYAPITYSCNGATVDFPFSWKILYEESVVVSLIDSNGETTTLNLGTDYNVEFDDMGGNIKTKTAYESGNSIVIARNASLYQEKSFSTSTGFQASEIEKAFDITSINLQDMSYNIESFKTNFSEDIKKDFEDFNNRNEEFKTEINNTISEVNTAAKLIKTTVETVNEAVEKCTNQANSAESSANTATEKLDEIVQKADEISSSADEALATIKSDSEEQLNKIKQVGFYRKGKHLYYKDDDGNEIEFKSNSFVPGTIYQVTGKIDESENLFRYANGQVVIEDDSIKGLTAFLDKQEKLGNTSIFCTEEEWQAEKTLSKFGQCGKYVRDKEAGTLRLPAIINLQGLTDMANIGGIKTESLPNIRGKFSAAGTSVGITQEGSTKFEKNTDPFWYDNSTASAVGLWTLDASNSSSTYQDNAPVQQEAIQYPYVLCVNSGTAEEPERPINNYMVNNPFSFGVSQYYKGEMNNLSWLRSNGQKNYKTVYPDFYNWALGQLNAGVEGFKNHTDENITDYDFVINQSDESFILPLKNGMETLIDYSNGVDITGYTTSTNQFKAPCRGIILLAGTGSEYGFINNQRFSTRSDGYNIYTNNQTIHLNKGDSYYGNYESGGANGLSNKFFPYVGNGSLYFYVGETVQNANLIDAGRIEEQLANKVDISNTQWATNACMPDYSAGIALSNLDTYQKFDVDGYIYFDGTSDGVWATKGINLSLDGNTILTTIGIASLYGVYLIVPLPKGCYVKRRDGYTTNMVFYPCKGVK